MAFSLKKAILSTHRHPANKTVHILGAPIYITGMALITDNFLFGIRHPDIEYGIIMYCTAITLFLIGHKKEGNLKAMTLILLYKYIAWSIKIITSSSVTNNNIESN
jgi:vacuolar-type H+-ATPase subunit I/STV1